MTQAPGPDPIELLIRWHAEALALGTGDPDAMALATANHAGVPSVRTVLYKGVIDGKIRFVTNFLSRKAQEIRDNPRVELAFYWPALKRQVRVAGVAAQAPAEDSEAYFASRPRESQLGAWASRQSEVIESREVLEQRFAKYEEQFRGRPVERPENWGAYWVDPVSVELWMAGAHRLHDRFVYTRAPDGWTVTRLSP